MRVIKDRDVAELKRLERIIAKGLDTFVEVGTALKRIRDEKLYKQSHGNFEAYCKERWNMARRTAYQYIEAGETVENVRNCAQKLPSNEAQARELSKAPPEQQAEVWEEVCENVERPTARDVKEAVVRRSTRASNGVATQAPKTMEPSPDELAVAAIKRAENKLVVIQALLDMCQPYELEHVARIIADRMNPHSASTATSPGEDDQ